MSNIDIKNKYQYLYRIGVIKRPNSYYKIEDTETYDGIWNIYRYKYSKQCSGSCGGNKNCKNCSDYMELRAWAKDIIKSDKKGKYDI